MFFFNKTQKVFLASRRNSGIFVMSKGTKHNNCSVVTQKPGKQPITIIVLEHPIL